MKKCIICNNDVEELNINSILYNVCDRCGFIQKDITLKVMEDVEKDRYLNHIYDDFYKNYINDIFSNIKPYLFGKCLDFGCGRVPYLPKLISNYGLLCDVFDKYFFDLAIDDNYDTIILIEVIEHIYDILDIFKYFKSILNSGGRIIISTILNDNVNLSNWWYVRDITHVSFFSIKTFEYIVKLFNFKKLEYNGNNIIIYA